MSTLQAMTDMQASIQSGLPVIPNNGNPAGAYNMPQGQPASQPAAPPSLEDRFPWLKPSPFMNNMQQMLAERAAMLQQQIGQLAVLPQPEVAMQMQPAMPLQQPVQAMQPQPMGMPVLPNRAAPMGPGGA